MEGSILVRLSYCPDPKRGPNYPQNDLLRGVFTTGVRRFDYVPANALMEDRRAQLVVGGPKIWSRRKVPMGVLHFRYRERRRTLRVALALPVLVHGQNEMGEKFCYRAMTRSVNQQGALLLMDELLVAGQTLLLVNENTNRSTETRVVHVKKERDGKMLVGLEFANPDTNFWKMTFPVPGARPMRRAASNNTKAMA
jgi:PilZ domain